MANKPKNPTSPGQRHQTAPDFSRITKKEPEKSLTVSLKKSGGRNNFGHMTAKRQGGGHKRKYRLIDFKRDKDDIPAEVEAIEYDPNRNVNIALLRYEDDEKRYILCPKELDVGDTVMSGNQVEPEIGNAMPMKNIPPGLPIHNIEMQPEAGGELVRSAGTMATLRAKEEKYVQIQLPSKELRMVHRRCRATIGQLGNVEIKERKLGKAGKNRHRNRRPRVCGNAMNPVSHPLGGGEGHRAGGRHPCSKKGVPAKGGKTRKRNKPGSDMIIRGRERGRFQK